MHTSLPTEIRRRVQRALRTRDIRGALRSTTGAIDLASIMVGVIVIGVIAGVIAATVFAVIPWTQNNAAKANLDAVRTAESVTRVQDSRYTDMAGLVSASRIQTSTKVSVGTDASGTCYVGVSKSATGKVFYLTDKGPDVKELTAATVLSCAVAGGIDPLVTSVGGPDPAAAPLPDQFKTLTVKTSATPARAWRDLAASADGSVLLAAENANTGTYGYLYTSVDGGATMTQVTAAGNFGWGALSVSADGTRMVAAVYDGSLYTSADSGATWTVRSGAGVRSWITSSLSSNGQTILAGAYNYGQVFRSDDFGVTWTALAAPQYVTRIRDIAASNDGTKIVLTGSDYLYTSANSGASWVYRPVSGVTSWVSVASSADGTKLVAAPPLGVLYTSSDAGATWVAKPGTAGKIADVASSADGTKLVATAPAVVSVSKDSGATWTIRYDIPVDMYGLASTTSGNKIIVAPLNKPITTFVYGP